MMAYYRYGYVTVRPIFFEVRNTFIESNSAHLSDNELREFWEENGAESFGGGSRNQRIEFIRDRPFAGTASVGRER
jgi:hypothetical protein